jgi:hypothetical protein
MARDYDANSTQKGVTPMAFLIDGDTLSEDQRVELFERGQLSIIQTAMVSEQVKPNAEIKLDVKAALKLLDFLLKHRVQLATHVAMQQKPLT